MKCTPFVVGSALLVGATLCVSSPTQAANFAVDSTVDAIDAAPGDGSCATSGGVCTLRAAIQEANALAGKDTVTVPAGTFAITIPFVDEFEPSDADGSFYLNSSVDLVGAGAEVTILDGGMLDRVLHARFNNSATLSDLTIQNGSRSGIRVDFGASLTLLRVTLQDNVNSGFGQDPGGIKVESAVLSLVESTVQRNSSGFDTGGIIFTGGTFSAVDTVIRDNVGGQGIVGGGMICNSGTATFERVAFIGNSGPLGGGLFVPGELCDATLTNVTLGGNTAFNSNAALEVFFSGTVVLVNVTVTDTKASGVGLRGPMTVLNTIVAGNRCVGTSITSLGYNIDEGSSCGFDHATDLTETDPLLGELDEASGSPAHPLLAGSPAIDAIPVEECLDFEDMPLLTDQRGVERPQGSACDIGAVEVVPEPAAIALQLATLVSLGCVARRRRG